MEAVNINLQQKLPREFLNPFLQLHNGNPIQLVSNRILDWIFGRRQHLGILQLAVNVHAALIVFGQHFQQIVQVVLILDVVGILGQFHLVHVQDQVLDHLHVLDRIVLFQMWVVQQLSRVWDHVHFLHYLCQVYEKCQVAIFQSVYFLFDDLDLSENVVGEGAHVFHGGDLHDIAFFDFLVD